MGNKNDTKHGQNKLSDLKVHVNEELVSASVLLLTRATKLEGFVLCPRIELVLQYKYFKCSTVSHMPLDEETHISVSIHVREEH